MQNATSTPEAEQNKKIKQINWICLFFKNQLHIATSPAISFF